MKLKYDCRIYDQAGNEFTTLAKGMKIKVIEVGKKAVKIQWDRFKDGGKYKTKFGFVSFRQFGFAVDEEKEKVTTPLTTCIECAKYGNCNIKRSLSDRLLGRACAKFELREDC